MSSVMKSMNHLQYHIEIKLVTLGWIMPVPVKGKPKSSGYWTDKVLRITPRCSLAVETGLGRKSRLCEAGGNLGQRRRTRLLPPKGPEQRCKRGRVCGWTSTEHHRGSYRESNKIAVEEAWHFKVN